MASLHRLPPFPYYFPVSSFVITALPLTLFIFTYVAFWAFGSSCLRFDRAIHQFLKVLAVADASKFAIDGKTASSGVMQEQRVEVLMQLRRVYGQLAHLSDEVVLTSAESSSLWNNIIADECLRLARDTVAEGYTDQKSLKTLWQLTFLCRSQLIALIMPD
ncbi:hypothetical protein L596_005482 [Steinernema carpocapsae]|uniref:Uncharacterized protein n=1 Tax=Steinernema carpocapsae TaxID=34508 RepID=A0A4U8V2S4_STECR|nr:hypothetical protein L596_005482 [Steinernema carpocapsae]